MTLQTGVLSQVTVIDDVTSGQIYGFKYRAYNRQGWSEYSDISYIMAANAPSQLLPVIVTLSGSNVRFSWIEPDDGAQPITAYTLEVLHYDGITFSEETSSCDGSLDLGIV